MEARGAGLDGWLGTLARYLYLADLVVGRDVLVLGSGSGLGCEFLANHGARQVLGVDERREEVDVARVEHALVNVEYRTHPYDALELEDDSFDLVLVHGAERMRAQAVVQEIRRVLRPAGTLVWSAPSADRPRADGGVSFHEFADRLGPLFGGLRMMAVQPLAALSLVEYADAEPPVVLDTSLARLGGEGDHVVEYMAVLEGSRELAEAEPGAGAHPAGRARAPRPYVVVHLPVRAGLRAIEAALGVSASDAERLRRAAAGERERRHRAESQLSDLKMRVAELERGYAQTGRVRAGVDAGMAVEPDWSASLETSPGAEVVAGGRGVSSADVAAALEEHRVYAAGLEDALAESREYAEELEGEGEELRGRLRELEDLLGAERARTETMRQQLGEWRDRTARAEGTILGMRARETEARAEERESRAEEREPRSEDREPRAEDREPRAEEREPRTDEREPRTEEREPRAEDREAVRFALAQLAEVRELLREHGELAAVLGSGFADLAAAAAEVEAHRTGAAAAAWTAAKQHQLDVVSAEVGARDADVMFLTIGLRSLKERLTTAAGSLEEAACEPELLARAAADVARRLRALAAT